MFGSLFNFVGGLDFVQNDTMIVGGKRHQFAQVAVPDIFLN